MVLASWPKFDPPLAVRRVHHRSQPRRRCAVLNAALHIFLTAIERVLRQPSPGASAASRLGAVVFIHRFGALLNSHPHFRGVVVVVVVVVEGVAGEVATRGYSVMLGYWGDQKRTAESIRNG